MKKLFAAVSIALAFTGCSKWQEHRFQGKAEDYIREHLKDPESGQFKDTRVLWRGDRQLILCGQLNARNGMGGMTGYVPFYVTGAVERSANESFDVGMAPMSLITDEEKREGLAFLRAYEGNCGKLPNF